MSTKKDNHAKEPAEHKTGGTSRSPLTVKSSGSATQSQSRSGHAAKVASAGKETNGTPKPRIQPGSMKGIVLSIADDFDAPLDDSREYT